MKRFLFSILMIAVLMPSLVCGMGVCSMPAQAAEQSSSQSSSMPCHEGGAEETESFMFLKDCMGIDFTPAQAAFDIDTPDHDIESVHFALVQDDMLLSYDLSGTNSIRGPPEFDRLRPLTPSILVTTQRLRI